MSAVSLPLSDPRRRLERLSNWLALLALLAGGIVFQDANEATRAGSDGAAHDRAASGTAASGGAASGVAASAAATRPRPATASSTGIATPVSASCYR
jgi:hypothetical protein